MKRSILIIDDSLSLHKLIKVQLMPENLTLYSAYGGEAGVAAAEQLMPGLILLDVDMPGIDGFEVCRRLKANPATASIPIVFLTAIATLHDRVRGQDSGALDYLSKPFKPMELLARVRAVLHLRSQPQSLKIDAPDEVSGSMLKAA